MIINLNGSWQFREVGKDEWLSGTVPGSNYADLISLNKIEDPYIGTNEKDVYWVANTDWEYKKTFIGGADMLTADKVFLECDTLDTICDVYFNDNLIGKGQNAHLGYRFDITGCLNIGENTVRVVFYSPVQYVIEKQKTEETPSNSNGQNGIPHIRKPQCHFGWDWGPVLPVSGITGNIRIVGYRSARIDSVKITQAHAGGAVKLSLSADVKSYDSTELTCVVKITSPKGEEIGVAHGKVENGVFYAEEDIEKPELWWTYELSNKRVQPLYGVEFELLADGKKVDSAYRKIGLRTLIINQKRDKFGQNFQFVLNGVPIFVKGANWIPPDSLMTNFTEERLRYLLDAARFSNMNMLRVWGGGYYESDLFYNLCDEYGILIWQDFQFACQGYPLFIPELLDNLRGEVDYNVKRIRHHAALAVWCGNNEIESCYLGWALKKRYVQAVEDYFYHILPDQLATLDTVTPYIPGSPFGSAPFKDYDSDYVGDTHMWAVWHGLQDVKFYRKRLTRFCSEFGFESLPDIKTVEKFAEKKDYSLKSEVFNAHQKCRNGNMKMAYYIASRFRLPKNFTDYIYLSQLCQEDCVRDATEHWRRNKGRCNGAMFWQLDDCWPVCSWASIDYYGNYKALQYSARHFNAPVTVSILDEKNDIYIYALNDTLADVSAEIKYRLLTFDGESVLSDAKRVDIASNGNTKCFHLAVDYLREVHNLKRCVLAVEMYINGSLKERKTVLFYKEKYLRLPKAEIKSEYKVENGIAQITLKSDKYVRLLQISDAETTLPFSDNFFDLLPSESVTVTQKVSDGVTADEYKKRISFFSAADVSQKGTRLSDNIFRLSVFLKPTVFGQYNGYKVMLVSQTKPMFVEEEEK